MDWDRIAPEEETFTTEMVWDAGMDATAVPREIPLRGDPLRVGPDSGWLPAHLITLAVAGCFMSTLLRLAETAGIDILGYTSSSTLRVPVDRQRLPVLTLSPCIVVASKEDAEKVGGLCERATELSDVCRVLRHCLQLEPDIEVVTTTGEAFDS